MQRIAPVDQHPVVRPLDAVDALEQRRVAPDVAGAGRVLTPALVLQGGEIGRMPRLVHRFVAGGTVPVERGAAPVAAEQVVHRGQSVGRGRIDVRDPLQERQGLRRLADQGVVAHREAQPALRRQAEMARQQRPQQPLEEGLVRQRRAQPQPGEHRSLRREVSARSLANQPVGIGHGLVDDQQRRAFRADCPRLDADAGTRLDQHVAITARARRPLPRSCRSRSHACAPARTSVPRPTGAPCSSCRGTAGASAWPPRRDRWAGGCRRTGV